MIRENGNLKVSATGWGEQSSFREGGNLAKALVATQKQVRPVRQKRKLARWDDVRITWGMKDEDIVAATFRLP